MNTSATSAIDDKIAGTDGETSTSKLTRFLQKLTLILKLTGYYFISGAVLFACKVGQSNLLPTDINCAPFTSNDVTYKVKSRPSEEGNIELDIFKAGGILNPTHSEKIIFKAKNNIDFFVIEQTIKSDSYVALVIRDILVFNYTYLGMFFGMLNQFPECLIFTLGPLITVLFLFLVFIPAGAVYSAYAMIYKNGWPEFNFPFDMYNFKKFAIVIALITLFFLMFFMGGFVFLSFVSVCSTIVSILYMNATINSVDVGPIQTGIKAMIFYKELFIAIICIIITFAVYSVFGKGYFVIPLAIVGLLTLKGMWEFRKAPSIEESPELTPISKQKTFVVKKGCTITKGDNEGGIEMKSKQLGGKNLTKEIIRVGNKLQQINKKRK